MFVSLITTWKVILCCMNLEHCLKTYNNNKRRLNGIFSENLKCCVKITAKLFRSKSCMIKCFKEKVFNKKSLRLGNFFNPLDDEVEFST